MAIGKYKEWLEEDKLLLLESWARTGLTDEQIAHNIGINVKTLYDWKRNYSQICNALKNGKEVIDIQVENALLKRALGYKYEEVKTETEMGIVTKVTKTTKEVLPDTTAQIFWLKNRKPAEWRDKREVDMGDNSKDAINNFIKAVSPTEEELKAVFDNEEE